LRYTECQAREAIAESLTFTEALRRLGMCWSGGNHRTLKKWAARWGIPTDHFDPNAARRRALRRSAIPLDEVLVEKLDVPARPAETASLRNRPEVCPVRAVRAGRAVAWAGGWCAVGRKYGVTDNAIRKWVRAYERERP
jgi:hypothetical protein